MRFIVSNGIINYISKVVYDIRQYFRYGQREPIIPMEHEVEGNQQYDEFRFEEAHDIGQHLQYE